MYQRNVPANSLRVFLTVYYHQNALRDHPSIADCKFLVLVDEGDSGGSLTDPGLDACGLEDVLFVELQLLGLLEYDILDAALPQFPLSTI